MQLIAGFCLGILFVVALLIFMCIAARFQGYVSDDEFDRINEAAIDDHYPPVVESLFVLRIEADARHADARWQLPGFRSLVGAGAH